MLAVDTAALALVEAVLAVDTAALALVEAVLDTSPDSWQRYSVHCSDRFNCSAVSSDPSLNTSYTVAPGVVRFIRTADPDANADTKTIAVPAALKSHWPGRVSAVNVGAWSFGLAVTETLICCFSKYGIVSPPLVTRGRDDPAACGPR